MRRFTAIFSSFFHKNRNDNESNHELSHDDYAHVRDYAKNRVIIRVWTSAVNGAKRKGKSVGHVSLQINPEGVDNTFISNDDIKFYMSLWPRKGKGDPKNYHLNSLKEDIVDEQRPPEYTFCFYSLNKKEIMKKYEDLYSFLEGWSMFCRSDKKEQASDEHSCVSFVKSLLIASGLELLVSAQDARLAVVEELLHDTGYAATGLMTCRSDKILAASANCLEQVLSHKFNSPDAIVALLQLAHKHEQIKFPLTKSKELTYFEETLIPVYSFEQTQDESWSLTK